MFLRKGRRDQRPLKRTFKTKLQEFPIDKNILARYLKTENEIICNKYAMTSFYSGGNKYNPRVEWHKGEIPADAIYFDASYSLILWYEDKPVAVISFYAYSKYIEINQIQAVQAYYNHLQGFRWEKMLIEILTEWAFESGFEEVRVMRAEENNYYTWFKEEFNSSLRNTMYIRYNTTPKRLGFKLSECGKFSVKFKTQPA